MTRETEAGDGRRREGGGRFLPSVPGILLLFRLADQHEVDGHDGQNAHHTAQNADFHRKPPVEELGKRRPRRPSVRRGRESIPGIKERRPKRRSQSAGRPAPPEFFLRAPRRPSAVPIGERFASGWSGKAIDPAQGTPPLCPGRTHLYTTFGLATRAPPHRPRRASGSPNVCARTSPPGQLTHSNRLK